MRSIVLFSFLSLVFITNSNSSSEDPSYIKAQSYIRAKAHNIGQGGCTTAELFDADQKELIRILMDGGSSAFNKEVYCQKYFLEKKQRIERAKAFAEVEKEKYEVSSPPRASTSSAIPQSTTRNTTPGESMASKTSSKSKDLKQEMIKEIRIALGMIEPDDPIKVTTFFVSHPDSDHYNLAKAIFLNEGDEVCNIILGGFPQDYRPSFRTWLQEQIEFKKTKVYFPALTLEQPIPSIETVLEYCEELEGVMFSSHYAPQMFSKPEEGWEPVKHLKDFEKALPFSKNIKTYLLSVNPTHWKEEGEEMVARGSFSDDDNSDSLVIKLQVGEHSITVTGDATELTTGRILRNYKDNLNFLKSTIITSDHHGSRTHGSNNLRWIQATAPQHVIFSCGIMHGHPTLYAYNNFKQSPNLARAEPHDIWVWEELEKKKGKKVEEEPNKGKKVQVHTTHQSLFSTFSSGTLTFTLPEAGEIIIESQILDFDLQELGLKKQYKASPDEGKAKSRSEEEALEIALEEGELAELEKSFLEETEPVLTPERSRVPQMILFPPESPFEPSKKEGEASPVVPLLKGGKKAIFPKKEKLAPQRTSLKSISKEKEKLKERLHKSSSDEEEAGSPSEEEEFVELNQTSSSVSSKKAGESEEVASSTPEIGSESKKSKSAKRTQRETAPEGEKTSIKEKDPKKQKGSGLTIKDTPAKRGASVTKAKDKLKKKQPKSTGKSGKKKVTQPTTTRGKKGEGRRK